MDDNLKGTNKLKLKGNKLVSGVKSITEFFDDLINAFKNTDLQHSLERAVPWVDNIAEVTGEILPPAKFLIKIADKLLKEKSPKKQLLTALSIAYTRAVEIAFNEIPCPVKVKHAVREMELYLSGLVSCEECDVSTFSLYTATQHEFVKLANSNLRAAAIAVGYSPRDISALTTLVQRNFRDCLEELLSQEEAFKPAAEYIKLGGSEERQAHRLLELHADYQKWLYEKAPVFGILPFALNDIYIPSGCSYFTWGRLNSTKGYGTNIDPFKPDGYTKDDLLSRIFKLIESQDLADAILIQGVAGSGKTSFTLKLCHELSRRGLSPIRVRIRDLDFDSHLLFTLPLALRYTEENYGKPEPPTVKDLFLQGDAFKVTGVEEFSDISKYVLILDGWDEISTSSETFKSKVEKIFSEIKGYFLKQVPRIRVILTGRPSSDISDISFLGDKTPVLTIQQITPDDLISYVTKLHDATNTPNPTIDQENIEKWKVPSLENFSPVFKMYSNYYSKEVLEHSQSKNLENYSKGIEVLGSPLLTFLAIRLFSETDINLSDFFLNDNILYKNLIDLTCKKAAKAEIAEDELSSKQYKVFGQELRSLLWQVAIAITQYGKDNIPQDELAFRLRKDTESLNIEVSQAFDDQKLSSLLISFYFKSGQKHLGCEFAHKSFREYLFAEAIFNVLKVFAKKQEKMPIPRENPLKDFDPNDTTDPRYEFTRTLSEIIAPQKLTVEIKKYLIGIMEWEINKSILSNHNSIGEDLADALSIKALYYICLGLADLWDWWGDEVHLHSQKFFDRRKVEVKYASPYIADLINKSVPLNSGILKNNYPSILNIDAQLGDGIYFLLVTFVSKILENENYNFYLLPPFKDRKCLINKTLGSDTNSLTKSEIILMPFREKAENYYDYQLRLDVLYKNQINDQFSSRHYLPRVSFERAELNGVNFSNVNLSKVNFTRSNLSKSRFISSSLTKIDFNHSDLRESEFDSVSFEDIDFSNADLRKSIFREIKFQNVKINGAKFDEVHFLNLSTLDVFQIKFLLTENSSFRKCIFENQDFRNSIFLNTDFSFSNFINVDFSYAYLFKANFSHSLICNLRFRETNLSKSTIERAKIYDCRLNGADLTEADLMWSEFYNVDLSMADLGFANLAGTRFSNVSFIGTNLTGAKIIKDDWKYYTSISKKQLEQSFFDYIILDGEKLSRTNVLAIYDSPLSV